MSDRAFADAPSVSRTAVRRGVVARRDSSPLTVAELVTTDGNRWSRPGEPTIYLGSDPAVALAEFARHLDVDASAPRGVLWMVDVRVDRVVDLRTPESLAELGASTGPAWPLDQERCRSMAADLRQQGIQGLIVPSVAFLDQPERWNLVVFVDAIENVAATITSPRPLAAIGPAEPAGGSCHRRDGQQPESLGAC